MPGPVPLDVDTWEDYEAVLAARRMTGPGAARAGAGRGRRRRSCPTSRPSTARLDATGYLADEGLATAMFLALRLPQPLLLEGEAGVGKTEAAKALARGARHAADPPAVLRGHRRRRGALRVELPAPAAAHPARRGERRGARRGRAVRRASTSIRRPLLQAIEHPGPRPAVLLVDELDRADDDFEAFLFELLAEASGDVPELGTIRAPLPPAVVLTSNRTRDLHDALKRRCLYHWIDYPDAEREVEIVRRRVPGGAQTLAVDVAAALQRLRAGDVQKPPGIAEAIDWVAALELLGVGAARRRRRRAHARLRAQVPRGPGAGARAGARVAGGNPARLTVDLPAFAVALRPGAATAPACRSRPSARRASRARSRLVGPATRERLYWIARATLVASRGEAEILDRVFAAVFGGGSDPAALRGDPAAPALPPAEPAARPAAPGAGRETRAQGGEPGLFAGPAAAARGGRDGEGREAVLAAASQEERLAHTSFADLAPEELAAIRHLVDALVVATPTRRSRRERSGRRGERLDLRATLRRSLHTGGDPVRQARRRRQPRPRRLVLICDVSGSMEPYARAYLQLLQAAVRAGSRRGLRVRHAADPPHPGAARPQPGRGARARRHRRARLVGRHAHRRRARPLQRRLRAPRPGARRGGGDPLRRLGARRPRPAGPGDGAPRPPRPPDRVGEPARRARPPSSRWPAGWPRPSRTSTRW